MRLNRLIMSALLVGLAAFGVRSSSAFTLLMGTTYLKGERPVAAAPAWSERVLSFYVNTNVATMGGSLSHPVTDAQLHQAAMEAAGAWGAACRADLRVEILGTTTARYNANDGMNVILWDDRTTGEGNYYGAEVSTIAAATTVLHGDDFMDCDIVLNGNATTIMKYNPAMGEGDLRSVLTHEVGHCLGLDHPVEPPTYTSANTYLNEASMVQTATLPDPSDIARRDINQDDRDGVECIYERGKPMRSGLHCDSYSGTNDQGALTGVVTGGPSVIDVGCGGDAQGRNALVGADSGDGCITAAIAAPRDHRPKPFVKTLGSTGGLLTLIAGLFFAQRIGKKFRRRLLHLGIFALASVLIPESAEAFDLELSYGMKKISPSLWNTFSGMDPSATAWDRDPKPVELKSVSEIRGTFFTGFESWGKWGGYLAVTLPQSLSADAKAQGASEQTKRTTISGIRVGPEVRWFPFDAEGPIRLFIGGRLGMGILYGTQTFDNSATSGTLSYRAWATEVALHSGAEIPVGRFAFIVEGGYSRHYSSYFSASGNSGTAYTDFPSGTRISTNTGSGKENVRFNASGLYAAVGLQLKFDTSSPRETKPTETTVPTPTTETLKAEPTPTQIPTPTPASTPAPKPRESWEIDPVPGDQPAGLSDPLEQAPAPKPPRPDDVPL